MAIMYRPAQTVKGYCLTGWTDLWLRCKLERYFGQLTQPAVQILHGRPRISILFDHLLKNANVLAKCKVLPCIVLIATHMFNNY